MGGSFLSDPIAAVGAVMGKRRPRRSECRGTRGSRRRLDAGRRCSAAVAHFRWLVAGWC